LINGTLYPILNKHFYRAVQEPLPYKKVEGLDNIDKIVDVDQTPIGRTPRSNPATYTGMFTDIRNLFSELPESFPESDLLYNLPTFFPSFENRHLKLSQIRDEGNRTIL
jgi:excinuclease UvrABC ATPase subunit